MFPWRSAGVRTRTNSNGSTPRRSLLELAGRCCEVPDLRDLSVLDVGCGTKVTKALLEADVPLTRYAGVDVNRDVVEFLRTNVTDTRFTFEHIDVQNDLYNPGGTPLSDRQELPVGDTSFDVIWLFSVFTHLAPYDFHAMLRLLRKYAADDCRLIFSLYVNEVTGSGFGPVERWVRQKQLNRERRGVAPTDSAGAFIDGNGRVRDEGDVPNFVDLVPDKPLLQALYSRRHAYELIDGTGWLVESLNPPEPEYIQHYFVCRPD